MSLLEFFCIVEGHGEVEAVPILIRRLVNRIDPTSIVKVHPPYRCHAGIFRNRAEERKKCLEIAAHTVRRQGAVVIIYDLEDECPARVAPPLYKQIRPILREVPFSLVFAYREYESWFLAAAESLRGKCGLPEDLSPPADPEGIRNAKGWLGRHMKSQIYRETIHQARLTQAFDLQAAARTSSFDKLMRDMHRIVLELNSRTT